MNIQVPDSFHKFLIVSGLGLLIFFFIKVDNSDTKLIEFANRKNILIDSTKIFELKVSAAKESLIDYSNEISQKFEVKNPLVFEKDSSLTFKKTYKGSAIQEKSTDLINERWQKFRNINQTLSLLNTKTSLFDETSKIEYDLLQKQNKGYQTLAILGAILLAIGLVIWIIIELEFFFKTKNESQKIYSRCQSCYKKFSPIRKYSSNGDSSINYAFCTECHHNGVFTSKYTSIEDVFLEIENSEVSNKRKSNIKKNIKYLFRWKNQEY